MSRRGVRADRQGALSVFPSADDGAAYYQKQEDKGRDDASDNRA
jgi:hypothetical protein